MKNYSYDYFATTESENYVDFEAHATFMQDLELRRLNRECSLKKKAKKNAIL